MCMLPPYIQTISHVVLLMVDRRFDVLNKTLYIYNCFNFCSLFTFMHLTKSV